MFSGIIVDIGTIQSYGRKGDDVTLVVKNNLPLKACSVGASIAHSGVCLTVIESEQNQFTVEVSAETLDKTSLGSWAEGTEINLESSLKIGDELSGHLVFGHIDTLAEVISIKPDGESWRLQFKIAPEYKKFIASKGSVTLDGISLTVNEVEDDIFGVCIIPHTWENTTLSNRKVGDKINLEIDMLARYVARMLDQKTPLKMTKENTTVEKVVPKNIAKNTSARLHAVQAIYQMHRGGHSAKEVVTEFKEHRFGQEVDGAQYIYPDVELFTKIVSGVSSRKEDLLSILRENLKKGDEARNVEDLLKAILLCGTLELLDHTNIDAPIIINDYVEVTNAYYTDAEKSLVNATLDGFKTVVR